MKFKSLDEGKSYLKNYLQRAVTGKHGSYSPDMTITEWAEAYSPASDNNNPEEKAKTVARELGVSTETKLNELKRRLDEFTRAVVLTEDNVAYNKLYGR